MDSSRLERLPYCAVVFLIEEGRESERSHTHAGKLVAGQGVPRVAGARVRADRVDALLVAPAAGLVAVRALIDVCVWRGAWVGVCVCVCAACVRICVCVYVRVCACAIHSGKSARVIGGTGSGW